MFVLVRVCLDPTYYIIQYYSYSIILRTALDSLSKLSHDKYYLYLVYLQNLTVYSVTEKATSTLSFRDLFITILIKYSNVWFMINNVNWRNWNLSFYVMLIFGSVILLYRITTLSSHDKYINGLVISSESDILISSSF